jgi:hypothetical protein
VNEEELLTYNIPSELEIRYGRLFQAHRQGDASALGGTNANSSSWHLQQQPLGRKARPAPSLMQEDFPVSGPGRSSKQTTRRQVPLLKIHERYTLQGFEVEGYPTKHQYRFNALDT